MMTTPADTPPSTAFDSDVSYVAQEVNRFFEGDINKVTAWWFTDNPGLGYESPASMVLLGRAKRLAMFVRGAAGDFRIE